MSQLKALKHLQADNALHIVFVNRIVVKCGDPFNILWQNLHTSTGINTPNDHVSALDTHLDMVFDISSLDVVLLFVFLVLQLFIFHFHFALVSVLY